MDDSPNRLETRTNGCSSADTLPPGHEQIRAYQGLFLFLPHIQAHILVAPGRTSLTLTKRSGPRQCL